jgi:large subunit ribosomal protein L37Ae
VGKTKKTGPVARFRTRGGASLRKARAEVEKQAKAKYECPQCLHKTLRKLSVGIWQCTKCGYTFAGGAWIPATKIGSSIKK